MRQVGTAFHGAVSRSGSRASTCQLKLFFSNGDKENFFRVMNELKASDITIDKETLELDPNIYCNAEGLK